MKTDRKNLWGTEVPFRGFRGKNWKAATRNPVEALRYE